MKNISLILMLSLMVSMTGVVASDNDPRFQDFESFKADLMRPVTRDFENERCKEQENKYGSVKLSAVSYIVATPFVALYHRKELPAQASMSDLAGMHSCLASRVWLTVNLYEARDNDQKQNEIVDNFKNTYEECMALHKSVAAKNEQSKK